jgi:hypothetical protein
VVRARVGQIPLLHVELLAVALPEVPEPLRALHGLGTAHRVGASEDRVIEAETTFIIAMPPDGELRRYDQGMITVSIGRGIEHARGRAPLAKDELAAEDDDIVLSQELFVELEVEPVLAKPGDLVLDRALSALPPALRLQP